MDSGYAVGVEGLLHGPLNASFDTFTPKSINLPDE